MRGQSVSPNQGARQAEIDAARYAAKVAVTFYRCGKRKIGAKLWDESIQEMR
ncbi:hypothetical protein D3C85_146610 [compost metagenome]